MFFGKKKDSCVCEVFPRRGKLSAMAKVHGTALYPNIHGTVKFYEGLHGGSIVEADIAGMPPYKAGEKQIGPFGFHIHEKGSCAMEGMQAGGHYNPNQQLHGNHAGDLPVLFSNRGKSQMAVFTDRFLPDQVVGKTVMIHENPDDFVSQPAGNSGARIACGVIEVVKP